MLGEPLNKVLNPTRKYFSLTMATGSTSRNWVKAKVMAFPLPWKKSGRGQPIVMSREPNAQ